MFGTRTRNDFYIEHSTNLVKRAAKIEHVFFIGYACRVCYIEYV